MSTPVFVDAEISTQADGAQSSRVPVPLPEDPYEAIRQAYLVRTNTESEPFEGEAETPESRHTVAPPTYHPLTHTTPVLVPSLHRTARMVMCVPSAMSPGFSISIAEVATMSDSAFHKRFRSSYDSSPSPNFPEEDKEVEESSDSDSESEDAEEEGHITEDDDPAAGDEGLAAGDEGPYMGVESLGLGWNEAVPEEKEEAVPKGQQWAALVVETAMSKPLGLESERPERVSELRQPALTTWIDPKDGIAYIDVPAYPLPAPLIQTPPSPEWLSGSLPISPAPSIIPSPISSPMISLIVPLPEGLISNHTVRSWELSPALFERYDRDIWELFTRPMLALEAWAERVNTRMTYMSWGEYDDHRQVHDMLLQKVALQRELREMRGRVTALEQRSNRKEIDRDWSRRVLERLVCHGCGQPCDGYYCESCTCPQCGMTIFNGICDNCIYEAGMPIICTACGGIVKGGLCLPCDINDQNSYNCDPNAYSFNNSNYFPQPQDENYLCNLCGNNSHDGYDCQQQFPFVYEQEPSYNQNYNDNYYSHDLPSFPCCDYCGGSHETFQCQPDNQNVDFSGSDQIQTLQYPDVNSPSPEIISIAYHSKKSHKSYSKPGKPFFAIQCSQPEDSNELFQKRLEDLKELAEYDQSTSTDRPIFLNDNEDHPVQNRESPENSSEETFVSKTNQEPPQDSNMHQLIDECCEEVLEEQKQNMEKTMLDLVKIYHHKQFLYIHNDVDDLIKSALDSKLLSIISINSQRLDKKEQEVKKVEEQPAGRRNRAEKSLQNFRVIHKSSMSFKNTSQISSIHSIAPILSTKEPKHLLSMGYEHFSITPETESDAVIESNAENLLQIPSKCEVTLEDEIKCDMPAKDESFSIFTTFSNPLFKDNDDLDSSDDESLPDEDVPAEEFKIYSNPLFDEDEINSDKLDPHCFNVESDFVESLLNRDTFIDFSSKFDFSGELAHIKPDIPKFDFDFEEEIRLIENLLYDNLFPRPPEELNAEIADTIIESIPLPIQVQDGEADLFLFDNSIPPGIENMANDPEGDVRFLEELLINDSILSHESYDSNFEDNPLIPRPPLEPPDVECFFDLKPDVSPLLLSAESEDIIFDPGISD
nr:hypothetical protein [Tanacetum cinerariifolium]